MTDHLPRLRLVPDAGEPRPLRLGAVELLPGRVRAALLDASGAMLRRAEERFDAKARDTAAVDGALAGAARCFAGERPAGIGVAAAGVVDPVAGRVLEVNDVPALHGYPVAERLAARTGTEVYVEHHARVQVLGDRYFGAGRGRRTFASVSTGEVLGVGLLYDGEVLAPPGGRSGAHMTVVAGGEVCTCGARGCWKTVATTRWLRAASGGATLKELAGTDTAMAYADNLALGLVNIQQLFAPGLFVVHGEAADGGEPFRARIERRLREGAAQQSGEEPHVRFGQAGPDDVALLGAAGLVLTHG
jgi:predicted NBD/HSP70 family sugar kinase